MSMHYVVEVKIQKVEKGEPVTIHRGRVEQDNKSVNDRIIGEVTRVVQKASTIEKAKNMVIAILETVEDE